MRQNRLEFAIPKVLHDMSLPILYSFRRCPYAIRARMAIAVSRLSVELREVVLKNKPEAMLSISPKATVPVLQLEDGVIDESLDVMQWALQQSDPLNLGLLDTHIKGPDLIASNDGEFKSWLDLYKYADRHPEMTAIEYRAKACEFLGRLEQQLEQHRFLLGEDLTFTDIAIFPFIRQFAYVDIAWFQSSDFPKLIAWLNSLLESELFLNVMEKYQAWEENTIGVEFPTKDICSE